MNTLQFCLIGAVSRWCIVLFGSALLVGGADLGAAPRIAFDKTAHDFGTRRSSETVRAEFNISNRGDEPLEITDVRASCGCTATQLDTRKIEPGASVPLVVDFSLRGRKGPQHKTVTVYSNDPDAGVSRLSLKATVEESPSWTPNSVNFGRISANEQVSRNVILSGFRKRPEIRGVELDSEVFEARWASDGSSGGHLVVRTLPPLPPGTHRATIEVSTDHPDYPRLTLPVFAYVPPPVRVIPSTLLLREADDRPDTASIALLGAVESFRIKRIGHPAKLKAEASKQAANRWTVKVSGLSQATDLDGREIHIETDVEGQETVTVPIRVRRARSGEPAKGNSQ
ncbi:MAG: DUF1573 domain-containing protein [bacterium]